MSFAHVRRGQICKQGVVGSSPIVSTQCDQVKQEWGVFVLSARGNKRVTCHLALTCVIRGFLAPHDLPTWHLVLSLSASSWRSASKLRR
jgi:hypothetical protein